THEAGEPGAGGVAVVVPEPGGEHVGGLGGLPEHLQRGVSGVYGAARAVVVVGVHEVPSVGGDVRERYRGPWRQGCGETFSSQNSYRTSHPAPSSAWRRWASSAPSARWVSRIRASGQPVSQW